MILAFSSFAGFGLVSLLANKGFLETSRTAEHGKWAKKEANVISYFLMTSGWHPCTNLNEPNIDPNAIAGGIWFALSWFNLGTDWACQFHVVCLIFVCLG